MFPPPVHLHLPLLFEDCFVFLVHESGVSHELFLISMDDLKNKVPPTHALPPIEMNSFSYVPVAGVDALRAEFVTIGEQLV
jgi:hypothetical protein